MKQARIHPQQSEGHSRVPLPAQSSSQLYNKGTYLQVFLHEEDLLTKRELEAKRHEESRHVSQPRAAIMESPTETHAVSTPPLLKAWRGPALCCVDGYDDETGMHVLRLKSRPEDEGKGGDTEGPPKTKYHHELVKCRLQDREHYCEANILSLRESLDLISRMPQGNIRQPKLVSPSSLAVRRACFEGELPPGYYFVAGDETLRIRLPLQKLLELRGHSSLRYICPALSLMRGNERIGEVEIPPFGWNDGGNINSQSSRSRGSSLESDADARTIESLEGQQEESMGRRDPEMLIHLAAPPASSAKWDHRLHDWKVSPLSFALRPASEWTAVRAEVEASSDDTSISDMSSVSVGSTRSRMKRMAAQESLMNAVATKKVDPLQIVDGLRNAESVQSRKPKRALLCSTRHEMTRAYRACLEDAHRTLDDAAHDIKDLRASLHKKYEKEKNKHSHHAAITQQSMTSANFGPAAELADIISLSGHNGHMAKLMGTYSLVPLHDTSESDRLGMRYRGAQGRTKKKTMVKRLVNGAVLYRKLGFDTGHFLFKDGISGRWNFVDVSNSNHDIRASQAIPPPVKGSTSPKSRQMCDPFAPLAYYSTEALFRAFESGAACIRSTSAASLPNEQDLSWSVLDEAEGSTRWVKGSGLIVTEGVGIHPPCIKFMGHSLSRSEYMGMYVKIEDRFVHGAPVYRQLVQQDDDGSLELCDAEPADDGGDDAYKDARVFGFSTHAEMEACEAAGFRASEKVAYDECLSLGFRERSNYDEYKQDRKGRFCYRCSASGRWNLVDSGEEMTFALNAAAVRTKSSFDVPSNEGAIWEFLGPDPLGDGRWLEDANLKCKMRSSPEEEDTSDEEEEEGHPTKSAATVEQREEKEEESAQVRLERERKERDNKLAKIAAEIKLTERRGREIMKERKRLLEEDSPSKIERCVRSLDIIAALIEDANQFVESIFCYRPGMKVMLLANPEDSQHCAGVQLAGCDGTVKALDDSGSYLIDLDSAPGCHNKTTINVLDETTHRPSTLFQFCPGQELSMFISKSPTDRETWVDGTVLDATDEDKKRGICNLLLLEPPATVSSLSAPQPKSSGYGASSPAPPPKPQDNFQKIIQLVLNRSNHYRRHLRQHEYEAERAAYLKEVAESSSVIDPATGKVLDIRRDLRQYLTIQSDASSGDFQTVNDIATFMATEIGSRSAGLYRSAAALIYGRAGSGKSIFMRQWLCLVTDTVSKAGVDNNNGMVPLLINAGQLQFVISSATNAAGSMFSGPDGLDGFMNGQRSLFRAYLERAFGPGGIGATGVGGGDNSSKTSTDRSGRLKFLLDALESQRLVVGIDGLEQAGDRKGSLEIALVDELVARGCQVLVTARTECFMSRLSSASDSPWRSFEILPLSRSQQRQFVSERLAEKAHEGAGSFVDMISWYEEGRDLIDKRFETAKSGIGDGERSVLFDHNGVQVYEGVEGLQECGRGNHRPCQDGSWRDTDFRRNCHELRRIAEKAKNIISSELEEALSAPAAKESGKFDEFDIIVNALKGESWVAKNAKKREGLHHASIGVGTVLDCCSANVLCGPGPDAVIAALEAIRAHPRFRVVRIKNLFCPPKVEVHHFRRLVIGVRVLDIEEATPADAHHKAQAPKSHICEVSLHLRSIFETFHAQPLLFKDPFDYFKRYIRGEVDDLDSREAWVLLGQRLNTFRVVVRSPLYLSLLLSAIQLRGSKADGIILPASCHALQKLVIEQILPPLKPPMKFDVTKFVQPKEEAITISSPGPPASMAENKLPSSGEVDNVAENESAGPQDLSSSGVGNINSNADACADFDADADAGSATGEGGAAELVTGAETAAMADDASEASIITTQQQRAGPQEQIHAMLEKVAFRTLAKRTNLFDMSDAFVGWEQNRVKSSRLDSGQRQSRRGRAREDPVTSLWQKLSDENRLPFTLNLIQPSREELEAAQLGINAGGLAGTQDSTKVNLIKANKCCYSFTDRSWQEFLVARCLLRCVRSEADETIDDIIVRLGLHAKLNPPKEQGASLQQFSAMAEAEAKKKALVEAKEAATTLAQFLADKKAWDDSFGNSSERRINPVWLSDGYFGKVVETIADIPGADHLLFPDKTDGSDGNDPWTASILIRSFGPDFLAEFTTAMSTLEGQGQNLKRRQANNSKISSLADQDEAIFEHRAYQSSRLFGPHALGLLAKLGGNRLVTVDCSGSTGLTGVIDPFEVCSSLQYLSLENCRGVRGFISGSNMALLSRLSYFNLVGTSIHRADIAGFLATSLDNIHRAAKVSQLPGSLVGSLSVLKGFRHLKTVSLHHLPNITGFDELVTVAPKLLSLELVDCLALSGEFDDGCISWLTNIRDKHVQGVGNMTIHPTFRGANHVVIDLCHVSSLAFQLDCFSKCANLRELRLRDCCGLHGTLEPLAALKENLEVLDLDGCGGGGEGEGRGGGYKDADTNTAEIGSGYTLELDDRERGEARPWGGKGPHGPLEVLAACHKLRWIHLCGCGALQGVLSAGVVKLISDIRREHGRAAVNMMGCGALTLEDDLEDEAALGMITIDLSECPSIQGPVQALYECVNLRELHFEYTCLKGSIDDLHTLTGLQICDLSDCQHITGSLAMFESMPLLEELDLRRCHGIAGTLEPLTACTKLSELLLSDCPGIGGIMSAAVVALISRIRFEHGQAAVDLRGCGKLVLFDFDYDLSGTIQEGGGEGTQAVQDSKECDGGSLEATTTAGGVVEGETERSDKERQGEENALAEGEKTKDIPQEVEIAPESPFDPTSKSAIAFKGLTSIDLGNIPSLSGSISALTECPAIQRTCRHVCLAQSPLVDGSFAQFESLTKLEAILVGGCKTLDCSCAFDHLGQWMASAQLESVGLGGTNAEGSISPLKALISINIMDLSGCKINGSLEDLAPCRRLEFLNLTDCPKLRGVDAFVSQHPHCEILSGRYLC